MEIELIGQALDEIKEEDQKDLSRLQTEIDDMEGTYISKRLNTIGLKHEYEFLENLNHIFDNQLEHLHMIMPMLEIPFGIILGTLSIQFVFGGLLGTVTMLIALLLVSDALYTIFDLYPKVYGEKRIGLKTYLAIFKKLFKNRHEIKAELVSAFTKYIDANADERAFSETLSDVKHQESKLKRELLQLEGYISSIEYIIERQYLDSLTETSDIVTFINKKKELKKDC